MSRNLHINLVKTKMVGSNKCASLMDYVAASGCVRVLTTENIRDLETIKSITHGKEAIEDIDEAIMLLDKYKELEFEIVY